MDVVVAEANIVGEVPRILVVVVVCVVALACVDSVGREMTSNDAIFGTQQQSNVMPFSPMSLPLVHARGL